MRTKAWIPYSGSVWASENMPPRHENPQLFDTEPETSHSFAFRKTVSMVNDKVTHFLDSTMEQDDKKVKVNKECPHRKYEQTQITNLRRYVKSAFEVQTNHTMDNKFWGVCTKVKGAKFSLLRVAK